MYLVYNLGAFDDLTIGAIEHLDASLQDIQMDAPPQLLNLYCSALRNIRTDYLTDPHYRSTPTGNYGGQHPFEKSHSTTSLKGR